MTGVILATRPQKQLRFDKHPQELRRRYVGLDESAFHHSRSAGNRFQFIASLHFTCNFKFIAWPEPSSPALFAGLVGGLVCCGSVVLGLCPCATLRRVLVPRLS